MTAVLADPSHAKTAAQSAFLSRGPHGRKPVRYKIGQESSPRADLRARVGHESQTLEIKVLRLPRATQLCCGKLANEALCVATMKAVLALAMGAAALAPSQPKVRDRAAYRLRYLQMTQKQKAADEAARRRPEAALSRRDGSLALPRAARSTNGWHGCVSRVKSPRAPKSSPTPDALHRTQLTPRRLDGAPRRSHTPHRAALGSR